MWFMGYDINDSHVIRKAFSTFSVDTDVKQCLQGVITLSGLRKKGEIELLYSNMTLG